MFEHYPYALDDGRDDVMKVKNSTGMVIRGGAYVRDDRLSRCGFRGGADPFSYNRVYGFRLLLRYRTSDL